MASVYIGLGTNKGNKRKNLIMASVYLAERAGDITALSDFYETPPWGFNSDELFLNAALRLETNLSPLDLLTLTQEIERELGRTSKSIHGQYEDRTIDIDLLAYDDLIMETPELTLPHPYMHERMFVLKPLAEIAPSYVHPSLHQTIDRLYQQLLSDKNNLKSAR